MNHHDVNHIITQHYRKLNNHFKKITESFDKEPIHEFRVEYKKLRAFLSMLSQKVKKVKEIKISKKLKNAYHILGSIRDLQLQRLRILEASKYEPQKPRAYRIILQKEIYRNKNNLTKIDLKNDLAKSKKKIGTSIPNKFSIRRFNNFIKYKWAAIYAIILSGNFSDNNIHSIRKHLKDLFYNLKEYEKAEDKNLSNSVLHGKNEEYFNQLLEDLGIFHDKCTAINLLRSDWTDSLNNETLIRIKQMWIRDKRTMKDSLVEKLSVDILPPTYQLIALIFIALIM